MMESPQSKSERITAQDDTKCASSEEAVRQTFQEELDTLRAPQAPEDINSAKPSSADVQLAPLEIVDGSASKKDASDSPTNATEPVQSFDNPYQHVSLAGEAMRELQALTDLPGDQKLFVIDDCGKKEVTVAERVHSLTQIAATEFNAAISASDSINQTNVESTLFDVRAKIENATTEEEKNLLQESETVIESLKHAPSATRFAFAMFMAGNGELDKAYDLLIEAESRDPEAAIDSNFTQFKQDLEEAIMEGRKTIINKEEFMLPLITMGLGDNQRQLGNAEKAEQYYSDAVKQADAVDQEVVQLQLEALARERAEKAGDPSALKELEDREIAWAAVAHAPALSRINYADFLLAQGRGYEASELLKQVQEIDPDLVKDKKEFNDMVAQAEKIKSTPDQNPFLHLENFSKALEAQDIDQARSELQAAVTSADSLDRELARKNKAVVQEQLATEQDPEIRKGLTKALEIYDAFDHAAAFTRVALGRFELAAKNYNIAKAMFEEAKTLDPEFAAKEEIGIESLLEAANEPSTFKKILEFTTDLAKELVADASAILAGAGAVVLTGWTGPGAVVAGAGAGAATYTTVKWLMGEEIHWYTPLWGAIDGATGSIAALARRALVVEGGKLVSKELAESAVIKVGGDVAALSGLEGLQMSEAAQKIASTGLRAMGKDIGLWSRISSAVPFIGTGSAEYRSALAAYRALSYSNLGIQAGINAGTALAASTVYRGAHEGANYYNGQYESFGDFAQAYGQAVFKDTLTGVVMGGYANAWKDGLLMSTAVNAVSAGLSEPSGVVDFMNTFAQKTSTDLAFGSVAWVVGLSGFAADRYIRQGVLPAVQNSFTPSIPLWSEAYYTRESIRNVIAPALEALEKKPTAEELVEIYQAAPSQDWVPTSVWIGA